MLKYMIIITELKMSKIQKRKGGDNMQRDMTSGSLWRGMLVFGLNFFLSYLLQTLYGLVDLFVVGQVNGAEVINAVSVGSQVMHMFTVITVGLAMGTTVMISRGVGGGDQTLIKRTVGNSITLFAVYSLLTAVLLLILVRPIVGLMMTPTEAVEDTVKYLTVTFIGIPFIVAYNVISSIFKGLGDSKTPLIFVGVACLVNIALDCLFVIAFSMGALGAAIATVIAQAAAVIFALLYMKAHGMDFKLTKDDIVPNKSTMRELLKIGAPISVQDGIIQISFIIITVIANSRGVQIAAAVGIVEKIIGMLFLVPSTMLSTVSALAAQNIGALKRDRAKRVLYLAIGTVCVFGFVFTLISEMFASGIVGLFTKDASVIKYGADYFSTYVFDCIFAGVHFCFSGYFCAIGISVMSFVHNVISVVSARVPGAYFASLYYPDKLWVMGLAAPIGSLISCIICIIAFIVIENKFRQKTTKMTT